MSLQTLRPFAIIDTDAAQAYLGLGTTTDEIDLTMLVNEATAVMDRYTGRKLKARPYLSPASLNTTASVGSPTLTSAALFGSVRKGMTIIGANIPTGTYVLSVESTSSLTMSQNATTGAGAAVRDFAGQGPMVLDGDGENEILLTELPIQELVAARSRDDSGSTTLLNITSHRKDGGILVLPNAEFPEGRMNIELECVVGYLETDDQYNALEQACKRLVQVMYQDQKDKVGRGNDVTIQGLAVNYIDKLPADIKGVLDTFGRTW